MPFEPEKKQKAVYILHNVSIGGVEVALVSAIPLLVKNYNLRIVVLGSVDRNMVAHLTKEEQAVFVEFNYPLYLYPLVLPRIVGHILRFQPEVMIASLWRASLVGALVKLLNRKIKFYSFNHSTRFPHIFSKTFTILAGKLADVILTDGIATSQFVRAEIKVKSPIRVVSFLTSPTPNTIGRPLPGDEVKFMFLGRINKVKNLPLIFEVIKKLRQQRINAKLDIYGRNDGGESDFTALLEETKDYIRFKGEIAADQRTLLFDKYDFYIQLSTFEGMAMSVAEAMQHGLVCVVSPVGEIIHYAKDMESAIFIDIHNPGRLDSEVMKICDVIKDKSKYLSISSKSHHNFLDKKLYPESLLEQLH